MAEPMNFSNTKTILSLIWNIKNINEKLWQGLVPTAIHILTNRNEQKPYSHTLNIDPKNGSKERVSTNDRTENERKTIYEITKKWEWTENSNEFSHKFKRLPSARIMTLTFVQSDFWTNFTVLLNVGFCSFAVFMLSLSSC